MSGMTVATVTRRPRRRRLHEGIEVRHARRCPAQAGRACACAPGYQAQVWSPRDQKPIRKTFTTWGGVATGKRGRGAAKKAIAAIAVEQRGRGMGRVRLARMTGTAAAG